MRLTDRGERRAVSGRAGKGVKNPTPNPKPGKRLPEPANSITAEEHQGKIAPGRRTMPDLSNSLLVGRAVPARRI